MFEQEQVVINERTIDLDIAEEAYKICDSKNLDPSNEGWEYYLFKEVDRLEEEEYFIAKGKRVVKIFLWIIVVAVTITLVL